MRIDKTKTGIQIDGLDRITFFKDQSPDSCCIVVSRDAAESLDFHFENFKFWNLPQRTKIGRFLSAAVALWKYC